MRTVTTRPLVLALVLALVVAGCAPAGAPATPTAPAVTPTAAPTAAPKSVLKVALLDDPSREAVVWAIKTGRVTSATVEPRFTFLPLGQIIPAAATKQFDVIEATPLQIPRSAAQLDLRILSSALVNRDGTILFTAAGSPIRAPGDLRGRTIGVGSLAATLVLETRFVLAERYGLNVAVPGGDVKFVELPQETIAQLLKDGRLDAAVLLHLPAYRIKDDPAYRTLLRVTKEFQEITRRSSVNSILVTYGDVARGRSDDLAELNRMLRASLEHFRRDRDAVIAEVAHARNVDPGFLAWWWSVFDFSLGDVTATDRDEISAAWEAARRLGDIKEVPRVEDVLYRRPSP